MAAYVYPGNLNYRSIQTIPVDISNKLRQDSNGVDAATKVQNLHVDVFVNNSTVATPAVVNCTVASVLVPVVESGVTLQKSAYLVNVHGWTTTAQDVNTLTWVGGFPRAFTSDQNVNPLKASNVLSTGTITTYEDAPTQTDPLCQFPAVVLMGNYPVVLSDKAEGTDWPTWTVTAKNYCTGASKHNFNFSFHLFVQPGTA